MKKKVIRLTEGDLHRIVENSVKRILKEEKSFNSKMKERIHKILYKNFLGKTISFDHFETINNIFNFIKTIDGVADVTYSDESGLDLTNSSNNRQKEFDLNIKLDDGSELVCILYCNLEYRMSDRNYPIYYDITSNIYDPNREDNIRLA